MKQEIHCPVQHGEFSTDRCWECSFFQLTIAEHTSVSCRKNSKRPYKTNYQALYWSGAIGKPDEAVILDDEDQGGRYLRGR